MKLDQIRKKFEIVAIFLFKAKRTSKFQFYLFLILVEACKEYRNEIRIFKNYFYPNYCNDRFRFLKTSDEWFCGFGKENGLVGF